jgi:hypothetical protein
VPLLFPLESAIRDPSYVVEFIELLDIGRPKDIELAHAMENEILNCQGYPYGSIAVVEPLQRLEQGDWQKSIDEMEVLEKGGAHKALYYIHAQRLYSREELKILYTVLQKNIFTTIIFHSIFFPGRRPKLRGI